MSGLAAGSFIFGRIVDRLRTPDSGLRALNSPLALYAVLEICIGISALAVPYLLGISDNLYFSILGDRDPSSFFSNLIRFSFSFILLFIPTTLMGGTLPVLSRYFVHRMEELGWNVGVLYAINTLGAVIGCFMTGYIFISGLGIGNTTLIGVSINIIAGIVAMVIAKGQGARVKGQESDDTDQSSKISIKVSKAKGQKLKVKGSDLPLAPIPLTLLIFFCLSGFTSLSYEILWTRAFSLTFYSTIYLFSNILTVFLLGIAIGSFIFTKVINPLSPPCYHALRGNTFPRRAWERVMGQGGGGLVRLFGIAEFLIGICALFSIIFFQWLPTGVNSIGSLFGEMTWQKNILTIFIIALIVMIIPTLLMGITFPLIGKLYADDLKLLGRKIGDVYSVNTVGSIAGSFSAGFLLIPFLGIQKGILIMAFINLLMGIIIIYMSSIGINRSKDPFLRWGGAASAIIIVFAIVRIATAGLDMGVGYNLNGNILFSKEDATATVKVVEDRNSGFRTLMVNNYSLATSGDVAVRFGHIPLLLHDKPEDVLVISLGSGITLGAVGRHPVKNIECVEIVPATVEASGFFEKENRNIVQDPRVKLTLWDGRNYVLTSRRKYDVLISDLFQPDSAGTGNLYSIEHYQNSREKLKKGGFMAQWLPLYQLSTEDLKVITATFSRIFPHVTVWYGDINSIKPTLLLLGSEAPLQIDISQLQDKMRQDGVLSDMLEKDNVLSFLSFFIMDEKGVSEFINGSTVNTDDRPYIEFSAPKYIWSRSRLAVQNFRELSKFRELPDSILPTPNSQLQTYFKGRGHIIQGRIYHADGLFDKEMEEYRMAEMENPFDPYLAFAYFELGYEYYLKGEYNNAVPGLERARLINGDLKEAQFYLAKSYYRLGMKSEYEEILRQNPEFVK